MLDEAAPLPGDPGGSEALARLLIAEARAQAALIEKLRHQLAGAGTHRRDASSESAEQLHPGSGSGAGSGARDERGRGRRDHGPPAPARGGRGRGGPSSQAPADPRPRPAHGGRDRAGRGRLRALRGSAAADRRGRHRGAGVRAGALRRAPHHEAPADLLGRAGRFVRASLPSRPIERARPGPGLPAHVLVSRYGDHLPLHRQSRIHARDGLDLDRSTPSDRVGRSTALPEPLAAAIGRHALGGGALFADDTPVAVLAPGKGRTTTARMWVYVRDERPSHRRCASGATGRAGAARGLVPVLPRPQGRAPAAPPEDLRRPDARGRLRGLLRAVPEGRRP